MEDDLAAYYDQIRDELFNAKDNAKDEVQMSRFLQRMIVSGDSWPQQCQHFIQDADVFNKNPNVEFDSENPALLIVKPQTESCGFTDGCNSSCWRIIGCDKLIKSEETGKILGFKKILKFCKKTKPREYKRSWVMEEYRAVSKWNWRQDYVICKIRLLFETEISSLLAKHFSYLSTTRPVQVPANLSLPAYGFYTPDPQEEDESYCNTIYTSEGNTWPSYVTNNVYCLHPLALVDPLDQIFRLCGICIFANKTCGTTDECDGGYWRILHRDRLIKSNIGETIGFKKVFKFYDREDVKVTWTIEEYRISEQEKQNKLLCVIKFTEGN